MYAEAIDEFEKLDRRESERATLEALGHAYAMTGKREEARQVISKLEELIERTDFAFYSLAVVYTGLGENEQALRHLEQAYKLKSPSLRWLRLDPRLDSIRTSPQFGSLLQLTSQVQIN
jgi:tetratricopeptide (TPR) repeat protein